METIEQCRIGPGVYRYVGEDGGGTLYRVLGFCRHAQHGDSRRGYQELVLYEGLDGRDAGTLWVTTLSDFALRFRREPESLPAEEGKVAGAHEAGAGY